jgi:hypothetical protein
MWCGKLNSFTPNCKTASKNNVKIAVNYRYSVWILLVFRKYEYREFPRRKC